MTSKANRTLGFLQRNLQVDSPQLKTTAYKALVRPLMEYAPTVGSPHSKGETTTRKGAEEICQICDE